MISFVQNEKEGVSAILGYSLDRFGRTGDNAIFISSELKKQGISITAKLEEHGRRRSRAGFLRKSEATWSTRIINGQLSA